MTRKNRLRRGAIPAFYLTFAMRLIPFLPLLFCLVLPALGQEPPTVDVTPLKKWIAMQADLKTVSADFTQTRRLRVLKDPVERRGKIWFNGPTLFRWELGEPPGTIVLRRGKQAFLISVRAKKAKLFDPDALAGKEGLRSMRDMPTMDFPMALTFEEFMKRFDVFSVKVEGSRCDAEILPKDPQAQKFLKRIVLSFDVKTGVLLGFEVATRDGSELRNEFTNVRLNEPIPRRVFDFDFSDYRVTNENP